VALAGENEDLGEEPLPLSLYPPQIPHGLTNGIFPGVHDDRPANKCLKYDRGF
jgi:hypothetical protein